MPHKHLSSFTACALTLVVAWMVSLGSLVSQGVGVARDTWVFNVYVDPLYGDDALATAQNPTATGGFQILQGHPDTNLGPTNQTKIVGRLDHAPYAFRTLTGAQGAIAYVNSWGPLPATIQIGQDQRNVSYAVIQCMPGMYGPQLGNAIDGKSGLAFNGEEFPVFVPERVCIQGASAMDTIFDARESAVAVFQYTANGGGRCERTAVRELLPRRCNHSWGQRG